MKSVVRFARRSDFHHGIGECRRDAGDLDTDQHTKHERVAVSCHSQTTRTQFCQPTHGVTTAESWRSTVETGRHTFDGNFLWSSQICLLALFVTSTLVLADEALLPATHRRLMPSVVCFAALALHVVAGVYFYLHPTSF